MTDIKITLEGKQGSGKTRLQKKIENFLIKEGFTIKVALTDSHGFTVVNSIKVLNNEH